MAEKKMTREEYLNRRAWLIDTAETAEDKKKLQSDLAKLDAKYKEQTLKDIKTPDSKAKRLEVNSRTRRSNQPRVGSRLAEDQQDDYHYAVEVAGQPASTPKGQAIKKRAEAEARDYERRFPTLSERKGTQANHTVTKVNRKTGRAN